MRRAKLTDEQAVERLMDLNPDDPAVQVGERTDIAEIEAAVAARREAEERVATAVRSARAAGMTWTVVGIALGVSHQAAIKRYGS